MKPVKQWSEILKNLTMLSQLGLSLLMPLLLMMLLCWKLTDWFSLGSWVFIPGFIMGLGGSFMTAYKVYLSIMKKEKRQKPDAVAFNRHH